MRRPVIALFGVLLFAVGVGVGVSMQRFGLLAQPAPNNSLDDSCGRAVVEAEMKKPKKVPSLDEDRKALLGFWVQPHEPHYLPKKK